MATEKALSPVPAAGDPLGEAVRHEILHEAGLYEQPQAACIDALLIVQRHHGWVSDASVGEIGRLLDMSADAVDSVATFYNGIYRRPVGRHVIRVCSSISCWVMGYDKLRGALEAQTGVPLGGTSADGRFTLIPIQCLGACDHAPTLMIGDDLHRDVEPAQVGELLDRYPLHGGPDARSEEKS
jgi:NADH-quinone oxidoreductase subunit E